MSARQTRLSRGCGACGRPGDHAPWFLTPATSLSCVVQGPRPLRCSGSRARGPTLENRVPTAESACGHLGHCLHARPARTATRRVASSPQPPFPRARGSRRPPDAIQSCVDASALLTASQMASLELPSVCGNRDQSRPQTKARGHKHRAPLCGAEMGNDLPSGDS